MNRRYRAAMLRAMKQARARIGISANALTALAAYAVALALAAVAQARPGDLDRTFSGDGRVITPFPRYDDDGVTAVAVRGRRIVAIGAGIGSDPTGSAQFVLTRYLSDGSLDRSFGDAGRVDFGTGLDSSPDGAIDAVGRIVVAASQEYFQQGRFHVRTVVARLTPSGELDGSFGVNGVRRIDRVDREFSDRELELGRDGSIIVAGTAGDDRRSDFAVIKLTPEGDLDEAFGNAGVKVVHTPGRNVASGVGVDRRGRITVGGNTGGISHRRSRA